MCSQASDEPLCGVSQKLVPSRTVGTYGAGLDGIMPRNCDSVVRAYTSPRSGFRMIGVEGSGSKTF